MRADLRTTSPNAYATMAGTVKTTSRANAAQEVMSQMRCLILNVVSKTNIAFPNLGSMEIIFVVNLHT